MPHCDNTVRQRIQWQIQGRLLRSLVHELSNPLQAITGAVVLAREDAHLPDELQADLDIVQTELRRMETLLRVVRYLYMPPEAVALDDWLTHVHLLARKELQWHDVRWEMPAPLPEGVRLRCPAAYVALLGLLQWMLEGGETSPRVLQITARRMPAGVEVVLCLDAPLPPAGWEDAACLLTPCGGALEVTAAEGHVRLTLPEA